MTSGNHDSVARPSSGLMSRIRNYFLTGLVVAGPVAITVWLIWWFVTWVDNLVRPLFPAPLHPETYLPFNVPGLGLIIAFVALTLLGFLTANLVGRRLVSFGEGAGAPVSAPREAASTRDLATDAASVKVSGRSDRTSARSSPEASL